MNQSEAEIIYFQNVKKTEDMINSMKGNHQEINALITKTYAEISKNEPAFLWFSLGSIVSGTVGRGLQVSSFVKWFI